MKYAVKIFFVEMSKLSFLVTSAILHALSGNSFSFFRTYIAVISWFDLGIKQGLLEAPKSLSNKGQIIFRVVLMVGITPFLTGQMLQIWLLFNLPFE